MLTLHTHIHTYLHTHTHTHTHTHIYIVNKLNIIIKNCSQNKDEVKYRWVNYYYTPNKWN
jgi:hypothetical protein